MECRHCGKQNEENNKYCIYCSAKLINSEDIHGKLEKERYETDIGFSNPNATYVKPRVVNIEEDNLSYDTHDYETEPTQQSEVQRKKPIKILIPVMLAAVVIVSVLLLYNFVIRENSEFSFLSKNAIEVYYDNNSRIAYVFDAKGELLHQVENTGYPFYNKYHTAAILDCVDVKYYINANKLIPLDTNLHEFYLSDDGNYLLYSTLEENRNSLYFYDIEKDSKELVDQVEGKMHGMLNILPGSKTISYVLVTIDDPSNMYTEAFIKKNGEEAISIGKDIIVLAVSEDMNYIYYTTYNNNSISSLYLKHNEEDILLSKNFSFNHLFFNEDMTEVIFADGNRTYISVKGKERQKLADSIVSHLITPVNCITYNWRYGIGVLYGIKSFKNKTVLFNDSIIRLIGNQYITKDISSDDIRFANYIEISEDGNELLYGTTDSRIMKVKDLKGECSQEIYIEHADLFVASSDLSQSYYTNNHVLYYLNDKNQMETVIMDDDVTDLYFNPSGDTVFFRKSVLRGKGSLYYSTNGQEALPVEGGDEVALIRQWNNGVVYQKEVDGITNSFYCTEGAEFQLLIEGIGVLDGSLVLDFNQHFD